MGFLEPPLCKYAEQAIQGVGERMGKERQGQVSLSPVRPLRPGRRRPHARRRLRRYLDKI